MTLEKQLIEIAKMADKKIIVQLLVDPKKNSVEFGSCVTMEFNNILDGKDEPEHCDECEEPEIEIPKTAETLYTNYIQ